jgi:hypothetical protein
MKQERSVLHHGPKPIRIGEKFFHYVIDSDGAAIVNLDQQVILEVKSTLDFLTKDAFVKKILHANANSVDFVSIGGTNSSTCGANFAFPQESFCHSVNRAVVGGDDVGV